jgi:hypothetical protein
LIALTADEAFARSVADRVLALNVATGDVKALSGWRRWLPQVIARLT